MKRLIVIAAAFFGGWLPAAAQPWTIANPDARTLGMGGTETAVSADAYAVFDNPAAGLLGRQKVQAATSFFTLADKTTYSAAGYCKFDMQHLLAGGWRTFGFGDRLKDKSVSLAYAYRLRGTVALGLTADYARFVRERIGNALSAGLAVQAVVPFERGDDYSALRLGAKLTGIGGFMNGPAEMKLPVTFAAGAAYDCFLNDAHALTFAGECRYTFSPSAARGLEGGIGVEYSLMQLLQFRVGYHGGQSRLRYPDYFSLGVGVRFMHLSFDAGYTVAKKASPMHNAYSLTIGLDL